MNKERSLRTKYVLIDFENVQLRNLEILSSLPFKVFVFVGAIVVPAAAAVLVPLCCDAAARVALAESLRQLTPYRDTIA